MSDELRTGDLRTGDIILFEEHSSSAFASFVDRVIRCFTKSKYSHTGIIIINPTWAPKGTYIWDSSKHTVPDPQDDKIKFGIALVPLQHYKNQTGMTLYKRSPIDPETYKLFTTGFLKALHDDVYGKHYDLTFGHWLAGFLKVLIPRSTKTFFCSAFVTYALVQADILDEWTDWTVISPGQLSEINDDHLIWNHKYGPETVYSLNK